jgi:hypothetical protein
MIIFAKQGLVTFTAVNLFLIEPNREYFRKWIYELHELDMKDIHATWQNNSNVKGYSERPLIERDEKRTLCAYQGSKQIESKYGESQSYHSPT